MPWTCQYCGKLGDRQGVEATKVGLKEGERFCQREGLATLKGQIACCNCLLTVGWKLCDYWDAACNSCIRGSGRKLPPYSARRRAAKRLEEQLKVVYKKDNTVKTTAWLESVRRQKPEIETIKVFDFDDCLFKTPEQPEWWPSNGYKEMMESLLPPLVPDVIGADWWDAEVVRQAKSAFMDPKTYSVLVTYRGDAFKNRIYALLRQQNIEFNEIRFRPLSPFLCPLESSGVSGTRFAACEQLRRYFRSALMGSTSSKQEKHTAIHIGDLLSMCQKVRSLHIFVGEQRIDTITHNFTPTKIHIRFDCHASPFCPHAGGKPSVEELLELEEGVRQAKAAMLPPPEPSVEELQAIITTPPAPTRTGARCRRRVLCGAALTAPQPPVLCKRRGPKNQLLAGRAWAPEADATATINFRNNRGGSKPPRGRTVATMHRSTYLPAWEEEQYGDDSWATSDEDDPPSEVEDDVEDDAELEHGTREEEWRQPPAPAGDAVAEAMDMEPRCHGRCAPPHPESDESAWEWDVLRAEEVESVSSDWYERDLDVISVASESTRASAADLASASDESTAGEGGSAWAEARDQVMADHDFALALHLTELSQHPAKYGADGGMGSWACEYCTFANAPTSWRCDMCSLPRPREKPKNDDLANNVVVDNAGPQLATHTVSDSNSTARPPSIAGFRGRSEPISQLSASDGRAANNLGIDRGFACSACYTDNVGGLRCCVCRELRPEEWHQVEDRRTRRQPKQTSKAPSQVEVDVGFLCACEWCVRVWDHRPTLDREADAWSGFSSRRGLKGSRFRVRALC